MACPYFEPTRALDSGDDGHDRPVFHLPLIDPYDGLCCASGRQPVHPDVRLRGCNLGHVDQGCALLQSLGEAPIVTRFSVIAHQERNLSVLEIAERHHRPVQTTVRSIPLDEVSNPVFADTSSAATPVQTQLRAFVSSYLRRVGPPGQ